CRTRDACHAGQCGEAGARWAVDESGIPAFFCPGRRRHTRFSRDWSSDVCSSDLGLDRIPDVFLGNEAHLEVELVEFARQAVSAEIGRASCREGGWIEGVGGAAGERRAVDECGDTEIIGRVVDGVYPGRAAYRAWA